MIIHSMHSQKNTWKNKWIQRFPEENREVLLSFEDEEECADVLSGRTVVLFRKKFPEYDEFDLKSFFFEECGYKVIWLFLASRLVQEKKIIVYQKDGIQLKWCENYDDIFPFTLESGSVDVFLQIDHDFIVRVDASGNVVGCFNQTSFLNYVGIQKPVKYDFDEKYEAFKNGFGITLNEQQERAMLALEGNTLLLAVPGSGKTTVLIDRLGYMIFYKDIRPEDILAVTFNKAAATEMKVRFAKKYGSEPASRVTFCTLNGLAYRIYLEFCRRIQYPTRTLLLGKDLLNVERKIYMEFHPNEYPSEVEIQEFEHWIGYVKNMDLKDTSEIDKNCKYFTQMYQRYKQVLNKMHAMDFDDQILNANWILDNRKDFANVIKRRYSYICVDEAQDTSKIQHMLIRKISGNHSLFMVGDEDQSIYGFRGAYPEGLLQFRYVYPNVLTLKLERNYRSSEEIVELSHSFINRNINRFEKNMYSDKGKIEPVHVIKVKSLEEEYRYLLEVAKNVQSETAFLYHDNESSVILADLLFRSAIPFQMKKMEGNFFETIPVRVVISFFKLSCDPYDTESFQLVVNRGILFLKKKSREKVIQRCQQQGLTVFDALEMQMKYEESYKERAKMFRTLINDVSKRTPYQAIQYLLSKGYEQYLQDNNMDFRKIEILEVLAVKEKTISSFLIHLQTLQTMLREKKETNSHLKFSTIHGSKGLEYENVYLLDVYDGRFPQDIFPDETLLEERRLLYVGMTRAKKSLYLFDIASKDSIFIDELFPKPVKPKNTKSKISKAELQEIRRRKKLEEKRRNRQKTKAMKDFIEKNDTVAYDEDGERWVKCEVCGRVLPYSHFASYGGKNRKNLGICSKCQKKKDRGM